MQQYEIAVLYHPDLEIDLEKPMKKVEGIVTENGGKIVNTDNWGKRKLAYAISSQEFAVYVIYTAELPAQVIKKINDTLNITDEVIRFLITKVDHKAIAKAEEARALKAAKLGADGESSDTEESSEREDRDDRESRGRSRDRDNR